MQNITVAGIEETANSRKTNEKSQEKQNNNNNGFDKKNYLNVRLAKGETKKELVIRLLPIDKDSDTPFKIIKMHNVKVPTEIAESGFKGYVCLEETKDVDHEKFGTKCPFCELRHEAFKRAKDLSNREAEIQELLKNPELDKEKRTELSNELIANKPLKEKWYQLGKDNFTSEVCIIRCIERGHEEDGPKFWKFTVRKDCTDPYNVINELVKARRDEKIAYGYSEEEAGNILDVYNGKDLKIIITEQKQEGNSKSVKTGVSVMDYGPEGPVSKNEQLMQQWIDDEKKWSDVFTVKPYDYLSIVLDGKIPFFDKAQKKWVEKGVKEDKGKTEEQAEQEAKINEKIEKSVPEVKDSSNSDLPF